MFKTYYQLAKPGIVYGNAIAAAGGFLLASKGHDDLWLFLAMLAGIGFVMGSACVFNNYIDRGIDAKMQRTKKRALATGTVPVANALAYGAVLGVIGFGALLLWTNLLTTLVALVGFITYVALYGWGKRRTVHGTVIGSVAGAVPPVVGYTAVTNNLDAGAWILFLILVCWQMPHFYAIATYRLKDYQAAGLPVLPSVQGIKATKVYMVGYIVAFMVAAAALTIFGYAGYTYLVVMLLLSLWWLALAVQGLRRDDHDAWARKMFGRSLVVLMAFCVVISLTPVLP